jgi:hypothetical protein
MRNSEVTEVSVLGETESTSSDNDGLPEDFVAAVVPLADGELTFPAPFDLASSAALALNTDVGDIAQRLFEVTAARETEFEVIIRAKSASQPDLPAREVIDTTVSGTRLLITLLESLIAEIDPDTP